jgi:hypothetical protein
MTAFIVLKRAFGLPTDRRKRYAIDNLIGGMKAGIRRNVTPRRYEERAPPCPDARS